MSDSVFQRISSASGTEEAYSVEARYIGTEPKQIGGMLFDNRWRRVNFSRAASGVPAGPEWHHHARHLGLLGYTAAQALRWWLLAEADREMLGSICIETRIVKHAIRYQWSEQAVSIHNIVGEGGESGLFPSAQPPGEGA